MTWTVRVHPLLVVFVLWGLSLNAAMAADLQEDAVIRVGGDHYYPPYEFINQDGEPDGYNVELTRAIADVMGMEVDIQLGDWNQMRQALEEGELDALQGMVSSSERAGQYRFSPSHAIVHQSIFARKGTEKAIGLAGLRGKEVIVQQGGIMHDHLVNSDVGARLVLVNTHASGLRLLASGKHDYALVANLPGLYLGRELALSNIEPVGQPFRSQRYGYAVLKGNEDLLARFSEGLAILKNTGRYQQIYDKWLGPLEQGGWPWKNIGLAAGLVSAVLLVVLGGIVIWNRMLAREVTRRSEALQLQHQQLIQADKMSSLGILVSGVAHEINNPSSLLLLNVPVLKDAFQDMEALLEEQYREQGDFYLAGLPYSRMREELPAMLDDMQASAGRIRRIVDDLRDFARQGPAELSETVDLNRLVATVIRLVDNTIRKSSYKVNVHYEPDLPCFRGNAQRIEQVVINLLVNACQALTSPEQGLCIATGYRAASNELTLDITDQGCGIEPHNLSRLKDPFFTTKREQGGIGLGLSVSAGIVQDHGGRLEYESEPGKGTRAILILPAIKGTSS
ncbi:transporter substrate-binding domain-containing protein [Oceanimonas baumannii]|uniref:histidine kinase n=1 Tax=Oceanimonas baumannii TaxID=129578 RepID=A0ABY2F032_9GAMM|nr:transporter substrate-binding domain-containing protein [Oceanimonas baumannii]MCC4265181.1 transporter substrate-binding domain-containing protein [Oceanimonas baumannii]TDW59790.1 amino acid-binding domain sensor histidine kinase [Oceanimonas baumannii]